MANNTNFHQEGTRRDGKMLFLKGFLRNPEQVGSVIPSSRFLERRIVEIASIGQARSVVELGPGTGGTTQAILDAMPDDARMLAIELNSEFVSMLESNQDPRLVVHHGSAEHLTQALSLYDIARPDVVVSGIPFSTMPKSMAQRILHGIWSCLVPGGQFVAYQVRGRVAELGREYLGKPEVKVELLNVPPIRVYNWVKPQVAL